MSGVWASRLCMLIRQDKVKKYIPSLICIDVQRRKEALCSVALSTSVIQHAFETAVCKKSFHGSNESFYTGLVKIRLLVLQNCVFIWDARFEKAKYC